MEFSPSLQAVGWGSGWCLNGKNLSEPLDLSLSLLLLHRLNDRSNTDRLKIGPTSVGRGKVHFTQAWLL